MVRAVVLLLLVAGCSQVDDVDVVDIPPDGGDVTQIGGDSSRGDPLTGDPVIGDPTPGDPTPGDPTPGDLTPGDLTPGDLTPGDLTPGDLTPGDLTPGDPGVVLSAVEPVYPNHPNWNDYVKNDNGGTSRWDQPEESCTGDEPGLHSACIHAGELRKVTTNLPSCAGITAEDDHGGFTWVCDDTTGTAVFYSAGLQPGQRLATLIVGAGNAFRNNRVILRSGSQQIAETTDSHWWNNPVVPLPDNSSGTVLVLDSTDDDGAGPDQAFAPGTIFTLAASRTSMGYNLNEDHMALVILPGTTLKLAQDPTNNCNTDTGETGPSDTELRVFRPCLVAAGSQRFLWIEGSLDNLPGGASGYDTSLVLQSSRRVVVRALTTQGGAYGTLFHNSSSSLVYDVHAMNHARYGFIIGGQDLTSPCRDNVFARVFVGNSCGASAGNAGIILSNGATNNRLSQLVVTGTSGSAILQWSSANHGNTWSHLTVANAAANGLRLNHSAPTTDTTIWQVLALNNNNDGALFSNLTDARLAHFAVAHNGDDGLDFDGSNTGTELNGLLLAGNNVGNDCEGCTLPGAVTTVAGVDLSASFAGIATTANYAAVSDWLDLTTPYQNWGNDAALGTPEARGRCTTGTCAAWDWRLAGTDTTLLERSGDGESANESFGVGDPCPSAVHGDQVITTALGVSYLLNATEVFFDARGNDDGLCESYEACIYSPHFGAYQGEGDITGRTCVFLPGVITGVTMFGYPITSQ